MSSKTPRQQSIHATYLVCPKCHNQTAIKGDIVKLRVYCQACDCLLIAKDESHSHKNISSSAASQQRIERQNDSNHKTGELLPIGNYQIIENIGKGGMGEVFKAYDPICGRQTALKRIRPDLIEYVHLKKRFLKEARITAQLTHPAIIPIYSIHTEKDQIYYTMPYVEGQTLRQILKKAKTHTKSPNQTDESQDLGSIPSLIRIFISICQAVAYAHSRGVLHRDLKPENIIVGKYGEVLILDWGLAKQIQASESEVDSKDDIPLLEQDETLDRLTRIGKVVGTLAYMAPERAQGKPATILTDIYALGVILYQILTLTLPFKRKNISYFKKHWHKEQLIEPEVLAPYREVPPVLSEITKRCLSVNTELRYSSVEDLIRSLENYMEGKSEWFQVKELSIKCKEDWEFQENVLLANHTAITRVTEVSDWVIMMVSKASFAHNMKIEAKVKIGAAGQGIGFLLSIPEAVDRVHLTDGYCLWLAASNEETSHLSRSSVRVLNLPDLTLTKEVWHTIRIEKIESHISFYLNEHLQFSYVSHIPLVGTHVGLMAKDADFEAEKWAIFSGSQNIMINCLAVPDAFLASKDFERALAEYRRIGTSFLGRAEGREALFRAGVTLLEKAKTIADMHQAESTYDAALHEFEKLHDTPGAPLEYLGKALVYQTLKIYEEEIKCFELALRRYKHHPLLSILEEQIVYRMHDSSRQHRTSAYAFICLVTRFLPDIAQSPQAQKLFESLQKNWENSPYTPTFFPSSLRLKTHDPELERHAFSLSLGFWLAKPYVIVETINDLLERPVLPLIHIAEGLFLLIELGWLQAAEDKIKAIKTILSDAEKKRIVSDFDMLLTIMQAHHNLPEMVNHFLSFVTSFSEPLRPTEASCLHYLIRLVILKKQYQLLTPFAQKLQEKAPTLHQVAEGYDSLILEIYLWQEQWEKAAQLCSKYSLEQLSQERSPLFFPFGCLLAQQRGEQAALKFFSDILDVAFPRSCILGAHYLAGKIPLTSCGWIDKSFLWERRRMYQQLCLYFHCTGQVDLFNEFSQKEKGEYLCE